ncbi:MAG: enoyl-CoA hydratase/isomerase family protein [Rhizomicrobium sp.]
MTVTLDNQSRRNALNQEMYEFLAGMWPRLAQMAACRVVILRGGGSEAFCSGSDLVSKPLQGANREDLINSALLKTAYFPKPLIAAVKGVCVGGGLELLLASDVRVAGESARFGLPEVRWGIVPSGGGALKLADQIGHVRAMDLLLSGRLIGSNEAALAGLVNEVCADDQVWQMAEERAAAIARASPLAVRATKEIATARSRQAHRDLQAWEEEIAREVRATGQYKVGIEAFLTKKTPDYEDS